MFGIGFGFGIKDKQGREAKFMMSLKIGSRLPLNHENYQNRYFRSKLVLFGLKRASCASRLCRKWIVFGQNGSISVENVATSIFCPN